MQSLLISIPWQGSESQILTLLAMGTAVGYSCFVAIAVKDTSNSPRKSFWTTPSRSNWKQIED